MNEREPIRQTNNAEPCPQCGSVYRRGDLCNACGEYCPERRFTALSVVDGEQTLSDLTETILTEAKGGICQDKQKLGK